ncbi:4854_t:CDS:10 [Entrophospora sp. SA101]|nr:4854_t:CDS:10 [Entrophospora sp. SA101]
MSLIEDYIENTNEPSNPYYATNSGSFFPESLGFEPVMLEGFVTTGLAEESSNVFTLDRVQFQFPASLVAMAVSNEILIMALETNHILRIDLQQAHDVEDIEIPKKPGELKIYKIFFDPTGRHLLITTEQGENFYLFVEKWKKAKALTKFKVIGWNKFTVTPTDTSTKKILIGSRNGLIYEAEIEPTEEFFKKEEKYSTTPTRIYQFIGNANPSADIDSGAMFESLFSKYESNPGFQELPGDLPYSELHFFAPYNDQGSAKTFAWLTGPGIYHGNLVFGSQDVGDSVIDVAQLLPYPATPSENDPNSVVSEIPLSIALTEFHFIMLYQERIRAICQLNDAIVYDEIIPLKAGEQVRTMTVDTVKNTFWVYTDSSIFELIINKEDRDVWKLYLEKQKFDIALKYCKNQAQCDKVLTTQADYYFSQGRFTQSANYYAQSTVPFEEVALKFVERDQRDALRTYLLNKLNKLRRTDLTQKTMISTWLVEIYLNKLNMLEDSSTLSSVGSEDSHLDRPTTYNLIASHGRVKELLFYATLIGDYEKVISHWIYESDYKQALDVLSKEASNDTFYKFAPILMEHAPYETVNVWMRQPNLNPRNLMPALLKYDHSNAPENVTQNQAIRYLQYVVQQQNNTDPAIHNFLLTLYATQPTRDEAALLQFLATEGKEPYYNMDYALRLCSQNGRMQSCVHIYRNMKLYEEAVDLALKDNDLELAAINAEKPEGDEELRKKLWLKIARHVVEKKRDIKTAMNYLQNSDILKIEDILPEICSALKKYNANIEELKRDMDEATKSAEGIRLDIRELRYLQLYQRQKNAEKHLNARQLQRVLKLQELIAKEISKPSQDVVAHVKPTTATGGLDRIKGLILPETTAHTGDDVAVVVPKVDQLKDELDDLVASECILCGDLMIKTIEQPFINGEEGDLLASWAI